ncbi:MAG: hypothetical protein L0Z54_06655, partial [Thermoplasmata archaeon]|nr:hypothetical protein [Thermoplasmata archaeon]
MMMNGKGEKGLIAIAVAFLLVVSAMSLMQLLPTGDDAEEGGKTLTDYTTTRAFGTMIELNSEPEDVEEYMDGDGDGDPEIDNGTLDEAGSLDPEEILDEDGDGEPDYDEVAGPDTPLGNVINSTESTDILDYTVEDIEGILDQSNESIDGEVVADADAERAAEYDPEEDASGYDADVLETMAVEEYHVLWGEGETPEATEDPTYDEHGEGLGLEEFEDDLSEYDASGEELDTTGMDGDGWSRDLYWTYNTTDVDEDGFPEYAFAILLINWTYDGDGDGTPEFRWTFLAGYLGHDNNSNNVSEYDAVLIVGIRTWDVDDDGTPDRVREWNWGRIRADADEDLVLEDRIVFAAYRNVDGEDNGTVEIMKWGRRLVDADDDTKHEEDTAVLVQKEMTYRNGEPVHRKKAVWLVQSLDIDDDRRVDLYRAVVIGHQYFDNDTDGNPEYTAAALGGVEESWGTNFSRKVLVITTEGMDVNDDGVENSNVTYVWWHQEDMA